MDSVNSIEKNSARRNKFIDKGIFWESFKQQKIPGILITAIYLVEAILRFINVLINYGVKSYSGADYHFTVSTIVSPDTLHLILSFTFIIAAPVLVLVAFNFLTKRNASDLWHSLPHKRETIFTSVFLSVVAWLVVIIVGTSIVSMTMGLFITDNVLTYLLAWLSSILTYLIQSLLMAACFTLAATLTGTVGNNIITGLLIAFGPSLLMSSINAAIIKSIPIWVSQDSISFLSGRYNILAISGLSSIFDNLFRNYYNDYFDNGIKYAPLIYSFVLAAVYAILACVLFKKRKSESAGQSSLNKRLHAVLRVTLCMVICVIILTSLFGRVTDGTRSIDFSYVIWFTAAAVVYFAYELITTRKFRNLLKALPGFGIVLLINIALYGFMAGVRSNVLSYNPSEEEIKSVSIQIGSINLSNPYIVNYITGDFFGEGNLDYSCVYAYAAKNVFLENKEVKQIVAKALKENNDKLKISKNEYNNFFLNGNSFYNNDNHNKYTRVTVNIDTGISTKSRNIYIRNADLNKIKEIYFSNKEFQNAVLTLPEKFDKQTSCISMSSNFLITNDVINDDFSDIYKKYREEISACSFDNFTRIISSNKKILYLYVTVDSKSSLTYPLCSELTPQSYEMSIEAMYKQSAKNQEKLLEKLSSKGSNIYIQITVIDEKQNYKANYNSGETVAYEQAKKFILDHKVDEAPKIGDKFVIVTCEITYGGGYASAFDRLVCIINLGNADINNMIKYYGT